MKLSRVSTRLGAAAAGLLWAGISLAATDAEKCQADKLKRTGQYAACRLKAQAKAIKAGEPVDYSTCDQKLADKFAAAETKYGAACPTSGDAGTVQAQVIAEIDFIGLKLAGVRYVDNGDGTVTDTDTGLMWEKKDSGGESSIHDKDTAYPWSASGFEPDGAAFSSFLGTLNESSASDPYGSCDGFAGYCDWRLPTAAELDTIWIPGLGTDPIFGPFAAGGGCYWTSTSHSFDASWAWCQVFPSGGQLYQDKDTVFSPVRAVRTAN